jgi:hypothetical protein
MADLVEGRAEARRLALRAAELGREDALALSTAGSSLAQVLHELDAGIALIDRACELNPNLAIAWSSSSCARNCRGEPEIAHAARAMRLSPLDPLAHYMDAAGQSRDGRDARAQSDHAHCRSVGSHPRAASRRRTPIRRGLRLAGLPD